MSLLVNAYIRGEQGEMQFLDPDNHSEELAGPENYRKTFYGGSAAKQFGLRLLPQLATEDLYVEGSELAELAFEANCILTNISQFVEEAGADAESLGFRIRNILGAIERAKKSGGSVVVW